LAVVRGGAGANFLTPAQYGTWGLLNLALLSFLWLRDVGVSDKYIQQSDEDQDRAFQTAFTLEVLFMGACFLAMLVLIPVFAAVYGRPELIAPGLVLATVLLAGGIQFPVWALYRQMRFGKQRVVQTAEPLIGFSVTLGMLIAGFGYWALVAGVVAGAWAGALCAIATSPYRLGLRFDRVALRVYLSFSWPIVLSYATAIVAGQVVYLVANGRIGIAGIGAIALVALIGSYTDKADAVITQTLYPAICAVSDRASLMRESFVKSNRLALMWGIPFGVGLALFSADVVRYLIGAKWHFALGYLVTVSLVFATNHIGFNWHAFYRARGETRPMAIASIVSLLAVVGLQIPLLAAWGLKGLELGLVISLVPNLLIRAYYVKRFFPDLRLLAYVARSLLPTAPAVAVVALVRLTEGGARTIGFATGELVLFLLVTAAATFLLERPLLQEVSSYLRRRVTTPASTPA